MFRKSYKYTTILSLIFLAFVSACSSIVQGTQEPEKPQVSIQNIEQIISATGKVIPAQWATISSPSPGIILNLLVSENQVVVVGQELLLLSGSEQISAMVSGAELELLLANQALEDLYENVPIISAQAQQTLANAKDYLKSTENTLSYLNTGAKQSTIDQAEANLILRKDLLDKAKNNFEKVEDKPKEDLSRAALQAILGQAQVDYDNALRYYNNLNSAANILELEKAEANVAVALTIVEKSQLNYDIVKEGPDPSILELLLARIDNAEAQLLAAQTALEDLTINAPFSGVVSQVFVHQKEWVNPSQPILIIGNLSKLHVQTTDLNEIDVAQIQIGQGATINFDALIGIEVSARVIEISSKSSPGTGVNYKVTLELDEIPAGLMWDMTAFIDINAEN